MPRFWLVVACLWLLNFVGACQVSIVAPILPRIEEALHIPEALGGTLVTVYAGTLSVCALFAGPVSDALGRRAILRAGSVLMARTLLLHAFVVDFHSMLAVRALAGLAAGALAGGSVYLAFRRCCIIASIKEIC